MGLLTPVLVGVEEDGVVVFCVEEVSDAPAVTPACELFLVLAVPLGAGVAWGTTAGGGTPCVVERLAVPFVGAASAGSSDRISQLPANDGVGAGPMAAPTATPSANIAPASIAVAPGEGKRTMRARRTTPGVAAAAGVAGDCDESLGAGGLSGFSVIVGQAFYIK
ncbi:MAG TPA: hypothetical protein VKG38_13755 [Solirubrobacteraceae bacterium]|nr:hypothetical protein [Solirubrobacteraceae bacterium]